MQWNSAKKFRIKSGGKKFVLNQKLDQAIKGKLSWYDLQPAVSPAVHYLAVVFRLCALHAHMHLWGQAWHLCMGKKQVMAQHRWVFSFYLCRSVAVQGAVAYLVSAFHSNDTELFSCLRLPCVTSCKVSSDKMKASTAACERWSKTSRFYSSALSLHYNHFFFFFFISLWLWKWHKIHIRSSVSICLAKFLHINLFGRNDKNQSARPAAYECQVTQIQQ